MIRGDSVEYELLKKWCDTLPFFEEPKSVTTCEIGVREGLGSQIIMMSLTPRIGKVDYQHYAIDPYNDLEYQHVDGKASWKETGTTPPTYPNSMRDQLVKDFANNPYFKFYNMTDVEYFDIFNLSKTVFDLVLLDGPHTTKDILKESLWFADRSRIGTRIIIDDYWVANYDVIKGALSYWKFEPIEQGKSKVCFERVK
tara:strand:- start:780 stop:1373 length:594 start_codon:yes stop_codon:yes gene_type:complete